MSASDIEHFSNMVSGCESISLGRPNDPDAKYAFAVLKLHNQDMGVVSGQEGFLDGIKKGASNAVKWVKQLMLAIGKWIKDTFYSLIGITKEKKISKEVAEMVLIPNLERAYEKLSEVKEGDLTKVLGSIQEFINLSKHGKSTDRVNKEIIDGVNKLKDDLERKVKLLKEGNEEDNKEASRLGTEIKKLGDASMMIYMGVKKAMVGPGWEPSKNLVNSVAIGGNRARAAVKSEIENNRLSIDEVKKSIKYAEEEVNDLYQPYEESTMEGPINKDKSSWTKETYEEASSNVTMNFSKERVKNIVDMYEYLREKGVKGFEKVG